MQGVRPGVRPNRKLGELKMNGTRMLYDYKLEDWLRGQETARDKAKPREVTWQSRVQYAAGHALNAYYSLAPAVRRHTPVQELLNRWWPKLERDFPSPQHYWRSYRSVADQLDRITRLKPLADYPVALYEQWSTEVSRLGIRLSMIFQLIWLNEGSGGRVVIQKFLEEDSPERIRAFVHMANVFWNSAYGDSPDRIEVQVLQTGRQQVVLKDQLELQASIDYVRLLGEAAEESREVREDGEREGKRQAKDNRTSTQQIGCH